MSEKYVVSNRELRHATLGIAASLCIVAGITAGFAAGVAQVYATIAVAAAVLCVAACVLEEKS